MSQLIFGLCQNPEEDDSNTSEGMDALAEQQAGKEQELPSSKSFHRRPIGGTAQIRGGVSQLQRSGLEVYSLTSKIQIRGGSPHFQLSNNPTSLLCFLVKTSWSQVGKRSHAVLEHTDDSFHTEAFLSTVCLTPDATMSTLNNYVPNELCLKRRGASDGYKKVSV